MESEVEDTSAQLENSLVLADETSYMRKHKTHGAHVVLSQLGEDVGVRVEMNAELSVLMDEKMPDPAAMVGPMLGVIPGDLRPMIKDPIMLLLKGQKNEAIAALKKGVLKYGASKIGGVVNKMCSKLPDFVQAPAEKAIMGIINKQISSMVEEAERERLGEGQGDLVGFDVQGLIMTQGTKLIGSALPPAIDLMVSKLPPSMEKAKEPVRTVMKSAITKITNVLAKGPSSWGTKGKTEITEIVIASAKELAMKLKGVAAQMVSGAIMKVLDPHLQKLPGDLRPVISDVLPKLIAGDIPGAIAAAKGGIAKYGIVEIGKIVDKVVAKLPFAKGAVKGAIMGVVQKQANALIAKAPTEINAFETSLGLGDSEDEEFNPKELLISQGVNLVKGVLPGLIKSMVDKLPSALAKAKIPLSSVLTDMSNKILGVLSDPANWGEKGQADIAMICVRSAKDLAAQLKGVVPVPVEVSQEEMAALSFIEEEENALRESAMVLAQVGEQLPEEIDDDALMNVFLDEAVNPMDMLAPLLAKIPADFRPLIMAPVPSLMKGDTKGAIAVMKKELLTYGAKHIGALVKMMTNKLPENFQAPAYNAIMGVINTQLKNLGVGGELGEKEEAFDPAEMLMKYGTKLLAGVLPGAIDSMCQRLPLERARKPLKSVLTEYSAKILAVVGDKNNWTPEGKAKVANLCVAAARKLVDEIKSAMTGASKKEQELAESMLDVSLRDSQEFTDAKDSVDVISKLNVEHYHDTASGTQF